MAFNVSRILLAAFGAIFGLHAGAQEVVPLPARAVHAVNILGYPDDLLQKQGGDLTTSIAVSGFGVVATAGSDASVPSAFASTVESPGVAPNYAYTNASTGFFYYYTVIGSTGPVPVDLDYDVKIATTGNGGGAEADFSVTNDYPFYAPAIDIGLNSTQFTGPGSHELKGTVTTNAYGGQVDQVLLETYIETGPGTSGMGFVDPHIYIDPAYLAANPGVSLEFSAGVGNLGPTGVTAVPEPANAALLVAGLSLFAALRRRRG